MLVDYNQLFMKDNTPESIEIAKRLKLLRESAGLSHEKLSEKLLEKYGATIKKDSLINYECTSSKARNACANLGMSAKNLLLLANFYNVSTDYILGREGAKSNVPDVRTSVNYTGLSEESIHFLHDPGMVLGCGRTIPCLNDTVHELVNSILSIIVDEQLHSEFRLMKYVLSRFEATPCHKPHLDPRVEKDLETYLQQSGLFILPAKDGAKYYAKQIGEIITNGLVDAYVRPGMSQCGYDVE